MQFHPVEARLKCEPGGTLVFIGGMGYVRPGHRPRHAVRLHALRIGVHLTGTDCAGWSNDLGSGRKVVDVGHPSRVHQLYEDLAALIVNRLRDLLPPSGVRRIIKAGNSRISEPVR